MDTGSLIAIGLRLARALSVFFMNIRAAALHCRRDHYRPTCGEAGAQPGPFQQPHQRVLYRVMARNCGRAPPGGEASVIEHLHTADLRETRQCSIKRLGRNIHAMGCAARAVVALRT